MLLSILYVSELYSNSLMLEAAGPSGARAPVTVPASALIAVRECAWRFAHLHEKLVAR